MCRASILNCFVIFDDFTYLQCLLFLLGSLFDAFFRLDLFSLYRASKIICQLFLDSNLRLFFFMFFLYFLELFALLLACLTSLLGRKSPLWHLRTVLIRKQHRFTIKCSTALIGNEYLVVHRHNNKSGIRCDYQRNAPVGARDIIRAYNADDSNAYYNRWPHVDTLKAGKNKRKCQQNANKRKSNAYIRLSREAGAVAQLADVLTQSVVPQIIESCEHHVFGSHHQLYEELHEVAAEYR